jgi:hypothetical protein
MNCIIVMVILCAVAGITAYILDVKRGVMIRENKSYKRDLEYFKNLYDIQISETEILTAANAQLSAQRDNAINEVVEFGKLMQKYLLVIDQQSTIIDELMASNKDVFLAEVFKQVNEKEKFVEFARELNNAITGKHFISSDNISQIIPKVKQLIIEHDANMGIIYGK